MLFLYRPRQTWMPFARPTREPEQAAYNRQLQAQFEATRRVPRPQPAPRERDVVAPLQQLASLHQAGELTDVEYATAKAQVLAG